MISEYVRNIAVFLLFISFIGIITPNSKYKSYINLILGFMLIFVMLAPISNVIASSQINFEDIFASLEAEISAESENNILERQEFYEYSQTRMILSTFKRELTNQIENIIIEHEFNPVSIILDISDELDNFGDIRNIYIHISERNKEENISSIIAVDRISIDIGMESEAGARVSETNYPEEVQILKNYISNFYNLSVSNIHITIRS